MIEINSTGDATVGTFLDALAARQSTPGGGAAAAVTGSQAAALVSMVINFTIGSKKYAGVQQEMEAYLEQSESIRADLLELADRDMKAFRAVSACYGMPKSTEAERVARTTALQAALKTATEVPFVTAQRCLEVVQLIEPVASKGNENVASDVAVAYYLGVAALKSAIVNVNINLKFIRDEAFVAEYATKRDELLAELDSVADRASEACGQTLDLSL